MGEGGRGGKGGGSLEHGWQREREVRNFIEFMGSEAGQDVVARYGVQECGLQLFAPVVDECAKTKLVGGSARGGRWVYRAVL